MEFEDILAFIETKNEVPDDIDAFINSFSMEDTWIFYVLFLGVTFNSYKDLENIREQLDTNFIEAQIFCQSTGYFSDWFEDAILKKVKEDAFCISFSPDKVKEAFRLGFYPMSDRLLNLNLLCVRYHAVKLIITFDNLHIPHNTARYIRTKFSEYTLTFNKDYDKCVECLKKAYPENWFSDELMKCYKEIQQNSDETVSLDSVEIWKGDELVAGEIGFMTGNSYASLSGFHFENDIGTVQMSVLGLLLKDMGFAYWDLGMSLPYKYRYGAKDCDRDEQEVLYNNLKKERIPFPTEEIPLKYFLKFLEENNG